MTALLVLVLTVQLLAGTAFAADGGNAVSTVKLNQVQQKDAGLTMYVSMSDANGYPCTGSYGAEQFFVAVDGNTLDVDSVEQFDPQTQGTHYVFSIDVSSSLTPAMMDSVRAGLNGFVDGLGPCDTVSVITFGEQVTERIAASADHELIKQTIGSLSATESMTALYKGVGDAVQLAASKGGRSAVIVITDGKNDPTQALASYTKDSIRDQVVNAQVPLYCIGLNDGGGVDTESLAEFASMTGGGQFVIQSGEISGSLNRVRDSVCSAITLHASLINYGQLSGFNGASVFVVRFEPAEGGYVMSNELQQNVNWTNVPAPESLLLPQIDLQMDDQQVEYSSDTVTVTGSISVGQGAVASEDLSVTVNGEAWQTQIKRNGTGYTFSASGTVPADTKQLRIRAEIPSLDVASGYETVEVLTPEATPVPVLSVLLNDTGELTYAPGSTVNITGEVDVEGEVDPEAMELRVNDVPFPMTLQPIGAGQYSFSADVTIGEGSPRELSVQVQHRDAQVYSRPQVLVLAEPTGMAKVMQVLRSMAKSGVLWIILGVLAAAAIAAVVIVLRRRNKGKVESLREDAGGQKQEQEKNTEGKETPPGGETGGTKRIVAPPPGTKRIGSAGPGGTRRISPVFLEVKIEESRSGQTFKPRSVCINANSEVTIGRNLALMPGGDKQADVVFDDWTVSAAHLKLRFNGKELTVEEMGSGNGTVLNGARLVPGRTQELRNGDTALIGETTLRFFFGEREAY